MFNVGGGKAIGQSLNFGFAGRFARMPDSIIATRPNNDAVSIIFGSALMASTNGVANITAAFTAADFIGVAGAEVKSALSYADQGSGGEYLPTEPVSVFQRGSISVLCPNDVPELNGAVYIRVVAATGRNIGDWETTADGTNNILIPNAQWGSGKDNNNVAELVLLTRANA
jgi:hypothetical protein